MLIFLLIPILALGAILPLNPTLTSDRFPALKPNSTITTPLLLLPLPPLTDPSPLTPIGPNLYAHWTRIDVPSSYRPPRAPYPRAAALAALDDLRTELQALLVEEGSGNVVLTLSMVEASHGPVYVNLVPDKLRLTIDMTLCAVDGMAAQVRRQGDWWRGGVYLGEELELVALMLLVPRGR
ncbi:MAG: hypothetical protein Q9195_002675 [Heterodermia aff. obscurata]